jgi:microcystin-dependent protein
MADSATEIQAKVDKLSTNMVRLDAIVNGTSTQDVAIDSGSVPSLAKFYAQIGTTAGGYVTMAQAAATAATASKDKSALWAESPDEVEPGKRSAKYWAGVATGAVAGVSSFNGRSGSVVPVNNDYNTAQIQRSSSTLETSLQSIEASITNVFSVQVGSIFTFAMATLPTGYLECNGAAISRTTYSALYAKIGTAHGSGDGSTTFNIPDLRGVFIRGWDHGRAVDSGRGFGTVQANQNASHTHGVSDPGHAHSVSDPGHAHGGGGANVSANSFQAGTSQGTQFRSSNTAAASSNIGIYAASTNISIQASGGNESRPVNVALMFAIKY